MITAIKMSSSATFLAYRGCSGVSAERKLHSPFLQDQNLELQTEDLAKAGCKNVLRGRDQR
jgi:hypothetical protein